MIFMNQSSCSVTRSQGCCSWSGKCLRSSNGASAEENVVVVGSEEGSGSRGWGSDTLEPRARDP